MRMADQSYMLTVAAAQFESVSYIHSFVRFQNTAREYSQFTLEQSSPSFYVEEGHIWTQMGIGICAC